MLEHEQPDGRGQVAGMTLAVDDAHHIRQCHILALRDLLQAFPERVLERHAGLMAADNDRPFDDRRAPMSRQFLADIW
jgi:hypothetical protein